MTSIVALSVIEENLETFSLVWLDASVNDTAENIDAQQQLRKSISFLKTFEDDKQCEAYIRSVSKEDRIILIISGRFGQLVVPRIHSLRQLFSIYVYCKDKKINEPWANEFKKVKGVIVLLDELISTIQADQAQRNRKNIDEPLSITFSNYEQSTSDLSGQFIHSQLLIHCLLRMESNPTDKSDLISLCQDYYQGNEVELSLVHDFEKNYSADRALWWYTREAFLYRMTNKALRVFHIDLLYLLRFFLRDIQQQLEQRQHSSFAHLYRGQYMSDEEIQILQNSIGQYIAMNSYFSTSIDRNKALSFLNCPSSLERVLFEIDADPQIKGIKPFANITSSSYFPQEEEVLFMAGSIFQLLSVKREEDHIWTIHIVLANDEQHNSASILNQMKNEYNEREANLMAYGDILRHMGKFNEAERYYRRFLDQSPTNTQDIANCYHSLGTVLTKKGKYDESLHWHMDSLAMKIQSPKPDNSNIAMSYNSIGIIHRRQGQYQEALNSYQKSLTMWTRSFGENHPKIAMCQNNIGAVYEDQKKYSDALKCYKKALQIGLIQSSIDHQALSATHNNMGNVYYMLDDYDHALEHYTNAFQIKSEYFPKHHPSIARALENIGRVHKKKTEMM